MANKYVSRLAYYLKPQEPYNREPFHLDVGRHAPFADSPIPIPTYFAEWIDNPMVTSTIKIRIVEAELSIIAAISFLLDHSSSDRANIVRLFTALDKSPPIPHPSIKRSQIKISEHMLTDLTIWSVAHFFNVNIWLVDERGDLVQYFSSCSPFSSRNIYLYRNIIGWFYPICSPELYKPDQVDPFERTYLDVGKSIIASLPE